MFFTAFIPMKIRVLAVILLLVFTTLVPISPVWAEEDIPTEITSIGEPEPVLETELDTVDPVLGAEIIPDESLVTPEVQLTPEQALVLALQAKITDLTGSYSDERVESIQINLAQHLLQVKVKPDWYLLESSEQDEMAQQLFTEAQRLAFTRLEMLNSQGQLVARNPVIGQQMIILGRYQN
ncbi:MAG: hypothetical protein WBA13_08050 [Microcoleaceae cyanobacterium]